MHQYSTDFLDLTTFKSEPFPFTNILDTKTFQKPQNLYQYTHFSSHHPEAVFKAIITGELVRYIRTNTIKDSYIIMETLLKKRLLTRGYSEKLFNTNAATVSYSARHRLLAPKPPHQQLCYPPLYKCYVPPQFRLLKQLVMDNYNILSNTLPSQHQGLSVLDTPIFTTYWSDLNSTQLRIKPSKYTSN